MNRPIYAAFIALACLPFITPTIAENASESAKMASRPASSPRLVAAQNQKAPGHSEENISVSPYLQPPVLDLEPDEASRTPAVITQPSAIRIPAALSIELSDSPFGRILPNLFESTTSELQMQNSAKSDFTFNKVKLKATKLKPSWQALRASVSTYAKQEIEKKVEISSAVMLTPRSRTSAAHNPTRSRARISKATRPGLRMNNQKTKIVAGKHSARTTRSSRKVAASARKRAISHAIKKMAPAGRKGLSKHFNRKTNASSSRKILARSNRNKLAHSRQRMIANSTRRAFFQSNKRNMAHASRRAFTRNNVKQNTYSKKHPIAFLTRRPAVLAAKKQGAPVPSSTVAMSRSITPQTEIAKTPVPVHQLRSFIVEHPGTQIKKEAKAVSTQAIFHRTNGMAAKPFFSPIGLMASLAPMNPVVTAFAISPFSEPLISWKNLKLVLENKKQMNEQRQIVAHKSVSKWKAHNRRSMRMKIAQNALVTAKKMNTVGRCYKGVTDALKPLGINLSGIAAFMANEQLAADPRFQRIVVRKLEDLHPGDIVVHGASGSHPYGHIGVYLGNETEASDHVQKAFLKGPYSYSTVFRYEPTTPEAHAALGIEPKTASSEERQSS